MRDSNNVDTAIVKNATNLLSSLEMIADFLGDERDDRSKRRTLDSIETELSRRGSIDPSKIQESLERGVITTRSTYSFVANILLPGIKSGKYDAEEKPKEARSPLSSKVLFQKLKDLNVEDDSEDGYGYERVDYYLNAAWALSEVPLEDIRRFTASMIVWLEAKAEWRKASKILQLCRMSKILGNWLSPEAAMAKVESDVEEDKELNKEIDGL